MGISFDEKQIYNLQIKNISELNKRLAKIFENSRDAALEKLLKYRSSVVRNGVVVTTKEQRLIMMINEINKEIADLTRKSYAAIQKNFIKTYESTYYLEAWAIEKSVNMDLGLSASYSINLPKLNEKAIQAAFDQRIGGLLLKDRTNRFRTRLQFAVQDAVAQNIIEGQTVKQLSKKLKLINEQMNAGLKHTQTIARTELLKAYSLGQDETRVEAEKSGVEFNYIWNATLDAKVRPDHAAADNTEALIIDGEPVFKVGGIEMRGPRIPVVQTGSKAEAAQVINCRCRRLNIPFGIKPTSRVAKTKEGRWKTVNGDLTAKEWIKKEYDIRV